MRRLRGRLRLVFVLPVLVALVVGSNPSSSAAGPTQCFRQADVRLKLEPELRAAGRKVTAARTFVICSKKKQDRRKK